MALIEATSRLFFKDERKAEARRFMFNADGDNVASLQRVKEVLMSEYGIRTWVASYGVVDFKITIGLKRLQKDIEYPSGRMIMADSEVEWSNVKNLLTQIPKTHSFYGEILLLNYSRFATIPIRHISIRHS